jgi:hypothetical protein
MGRIGQRCTIVVICISCKERPPLKSELASGALAQLAADAAAPDPGTVRPADAGPSSAEVVAEIATVGDPVRILDLDAKQGEEFANCRFAVEFGSRIILQTDCHDDADPNHGQPRINVLRDAHAPIAPFDQVIVFQQSGMGNACNGGPIWFLGLKRDGSYRVSDRIDFCGGKDPVVSIKKGWIEVTLPGGLANRGTGTVPTERWIYRDGVVKRTKP